MAHGFHKDIFVWQGLKKVSTVELRILCYHRMTPNTDTSRNSIINRTLITLPTQIITFRLMQVTLTNSYIRSNMVRSYKPWQYITWTCWRWPSRILLLHDENNLKTNSSALIHTTSELERQTDGHTSHSAELYNGYWCSPVTNLCQ